VHEGTKDESGGSAAQVEIVMAAYQGGPYIAAQIESIVRQSRTDWVLRARDDNSTDDTYAVARSFAADNPSHVVAQRRATNSGSAQRNFLELVQTSTGAYVMLADDDDVWLENKIDVTFREMQRIEARFGTDVPILVHTDLSVADAELRVIRSSMARSQRLAVREERLQRLLVQNSVTGCTVMINRALADMVREPFEGVAMHDWWLALLASAFGRIGYVARPTVLYRQHGRNAVGAVDARSPKYLAGRATGGDESRERIRVASRQALAFLDAYGSRLSVPQLDAVTALARLSDGGKVDRVAALVRHGLWKNTALRRLGQVWFV
jgi:hypothetical protein